MRIVFVTGMSGAGKRTALKVFEDAGYYCVDNLPVALVMKFVELAASSSGQKKDGKAIDNIAMGTGVAAGNISVVAYQRPYFQDKASGNILSNVTFWLQILLAVVILGILVFVVIRSAVPLTVNETEPELSVEEMLATTREKQPAVDDIDMQEKSETRKAIEKFVDENPEAVALLLRNWLNEGWD